MAVPADLPGSELPRGRCPVRILLVLGLLAGLARAQGDAPAAMQDAEAALAGRYLEARGDARLELAGKLRQAGAAGGLALLARLEAGAVSPAAFELCLELLPASATARVRALGPRLDPGGRAAALAWLARRDVAGFRDVRAERAAALFDFVDGGGPLAERAAEHLADWDQDDVAAGIADRLERHLRAAPRLPRELALQLATSFGRLEASKGHVAALLGPVAEAAPVLLPALLPALGRMPDLVLEGALDPWLEAKAPALRQAANAAFAQADFELFVQLRHEDRVRLLRRCRERSLQPVPWALAEAHAALFGLGDPAAAAPALEALRSETLRAAQWAEAESLTAIAALLAGADPSAALESAEQHGRAAFDRAQREALATDLMAGPVPEDFALFRHWRERVPPELGEQDFEQLLAQLRRRGGPVYDRLRVAGRRYLATQLLASVVHALRGRRAEAELALDRARRTWEEIGLEWSEELAGPNRELDEALQLRSGALQLLDRALEGNEAAAARLDPGERDRRLRLAEQGYRHLIDGLSVRLPGRVLEGHWARESPQPYDDREYVYSDVTGLFASFYERIGEEEKAIALYEHLIARLEHAGESRNRFLWASYLFSRASIAMDRKDVETAKRCLEQYLDHYRSRHRDVVQNPDRYVDAAAAEAWFAGRVAAGYVSLAVLHNVVLHDTDTARTFIERAYTLEDSVFNRVLYACYLARDGRKGEALALLARVEPQPAIYYNLACTYALCGMHEKALEYLALDLQKNHPTRKSRNRQREWARGDRDLESLRGDPRYEALVRERAEGEER